MPATTEKRKTPFSSLSLPVFLSANLVIFGVLALAIFLPNTKEVFSAIQSWIVTNAKWYYVLSVGIILASCIFIVISRYGDIRLGPDHSRSEYTSFSWFAMLFSTGMGIGIMFFGVAEPVMHYIAPPTGDPETIAAATEAMRLTFFHWGLHAWAIYAVVGLILAYFCFRHNLPLALRSALYPLIGEKIYGKWGHAIDTFAVVGTAFGVATSLGYGVEQIYAGLDYLSSYRITAFAKNHPFITVTMIKMALIVVTTMGATISVSLGLNRGIKILSEINLYLALGLMLLVLFLGGRTVDLLQAYLQNTGGYLSDIVNKTFNLYTYEPKNPTDWVGGWTILYWGWWISWSPFVGMFIARISRGRTIRVFLLGVLLVPAGFTLLWMTVFGNSAIDIIRIDGVRDIVNAVNTDKSLAIFVFLESFPFSSIISGITIMMVAVFFITSADSGALVMDMLASGSKTNTPLWQRIFWGSITGVIAIVLMSSDGLEALQTATIASALPFSMILLISLYGLFKALKIDHGKKEIRANASMYVQSSVSAGGWQKRLRSLVLYPRRAHVIRFIEDVVIPAFEEVGEELTKQGIKVEIVKTEECDVLFEVDHGKNANFIYRVKARHYLKPDFSFEESSTVEPDDQKYFRAEVYLDDGAKGYDIMGYSKENISNDIVDQYTSHLYFIHNYQLEQNYVLEEEIAKFEKTVYKC